MPEARLEVTLGSTKFVGEGSESWLSGEFEKFLKEMPTISASHPSEPNTGGDAVDPAAFPEQKSSVTLPIFLQNTAATANQVRKFVATATWLQDRNNGAEVKTADVTKALRDSRQTRLTNAADALNQNVSKGFCEKTPSGFFVTDEGRASLKV